MSEDLSAGERYLQQLAESLEPLGPRETSEVLSEIWSHITDAVTDGDDEDEVLARFGNPVCARGFSPVVTAPGAWLAGPRTAGAT